RFYMYAYRVARGQINRDEAVMRIHDCIEIDILACPDAEVCRRLRSAQDIYQNHPDWWGLRQKGTSYDVCDKTDV
ncbi:MAG: hypothetical protein ACRCWR_00230, partial [Saezia sp.]